MRRGATAQIRDFVFDSEMRLASVTQPENGTVSCTCDAQSRVAMKTDAKNQGVEYVYDAYNRLSMVKRYPAAGGNEDLTQRTTFEYDLGTGQTGPVGANIAHNYSATANDGRLVSRRDVTSGEEVAYQYDELGRLIAAATAGPTWGLAWTFDGFGNRLSHPPAPIAPSCQIVSSLTPETGQMVSQAFNYPHLPACPEGGPAEPWGFGYTMRLRCQNKSG